MHQEQGTRYGRRRRTRRLGSKPGGHVTGAGSANGPVAPNGCTKTSGTTPAAALNGTKVQVMLNGCIKVGSEGTSAETSRTLAAGRENDGGGPVRGSVRRGSDPAARARARNSERVTPEKSATKKRKRKKVKQIKRDTEVNCPDKRELPLLPPQEENWENEIQDVSFMNETYGPEDVLHFKLQDLTLQHRVACDLPAAARYSPAAHHPQPVRWSRHRTPTEPDQFADAEDAVGPFARSRLQTMVSPTMKAVVDAVWAVWSIGASIYDYIHTNAMEERIHALENVITVHQCVIGLLSAGVLALFTYILFKKL